MELSRAIRGRRMIRRYDPDRPVPDEAVLACLGAAIRAPSAGFSQGWDFLVLRSPEERATFWSATTGDQPPDTWLAGMATAPALILCLSDPERYLERYAQPDKGWTDRDPARWPVPYWDVDTGMAAMLALLTAVDAGLGACFFGVPPTRHTEVRSALGIPDDRRFVGVISLGYAVPHPASPSLARGRRGLDEVAHWGRFGVHDPLP
ncbi:MAG: nitroreductase family protein [Actinomycetales bacterium]|jgi:nitroreductase|uniref:Nitroreductase family protein n=1 Tax=Candidatus Phosphoribacter hodrii TaxID=2953743 RepID=A0A935IQ70_9MICO|nr:nitroreductase family protein [Candidatus Phosphoribacter hodrii]MBK6442920.1 nitroreductase family protein [Candidatus Phosphoribacter baldrii]MBP8837196.1 nitroreductase family protein [Dermatophilaceae bacterium]MBK7274643.1 nitroreductase family protein [Candidatus Phosphoribacter hodrii]MBL0004643.1 nitroreductase family protein [Candidatus Phosphoribacter hodrii]